MQFRYAEGLPCVPDFANLVSDELPILARPSDSVRPPQPPPEAWRQALREAVRDPVELAALLELPDDWCRKHLLAESAFPLLVPRGYLARMEPGDVGDPLLLQVLPHAAEQESPAGFVADPVGDSKSTLAPGLLQKYRGRALLVATGACAVHCRYCFRRHYPYAEASLSSSVVDRVVEQLSADDSIHEIILSGGDPLSLGDDRLGQLCHRLAAVPHIARLRIHTRWPIVIPERVTDRFVAMLSELRTTNVVVIHANHANELAGDVPTAIERLRASGAMLLNQAVLLRGVNDSLCALQNLSQRLIECRVVPYYLHQLDRVIGAARFEVPIETGRELIAQLRRELPGYMVPSYVQEVAGEPHKIPLA